MQPYHIVAIIPARGNSKRLPRKNIVNLWGQPMLSWAIKACKETSYAVQPYVSSEDDEILHVAKSYGADIHKRDASLSEDNVFKQDVIRVAAKYVAEQSGHKPDIIISLQANSPQIRPWHIDNAIHILQQYNRDEIFSVDNNLMQNAAFRVMRYDYVFQRDLSTNCGVFICDLLDVHTQEDIDKLETLGRYK